MTDAEFARILLQQQQQAQQEHNDRVAAALSHADSRGVNSRFTPTPPSDATSNPRELVRTGIQIKNGGN